MSQEYFSNCYYIYRHIRKDKNVPFYIGMGKADLNANTYLKMYQRGHNFLKRNNYWTKVYKKTEIKVEILLENLTKEQAINKEIEFINLYGRKNLKKGTLTNLTDGGEGTVNKDLKTRLKISKANKGIKRSEETKNKLKEIRKNQVRFPCSEITKTKIANANKGNKNGMYGKHGQDNPKSKTVYQVTYEGKIIKKWVNAREAAAGLNLNYKLISAHARKKWSNSKNKSKHSFTWRFEKDVSIEELSKYETNLQIHL